MFPCLALSCPVTSHHTPALCDNFLPGRGICLPTFSHGQVRRRRRLGWVGGGGGGEGITDHVLYLVRCGPLAAIVSSACMREGVRGGVTDPPTSYSRVHTMRKATV